MRDRDASPDEALASEANQPGLDVSSPSEQSSARLIVDEQAHRWRRENAEALGSSNAFVEHRGLPLASFRQF
jgi:antitoxin CcdA